LLLLQTNVLYICSPEDTSIPVCDRHRRQGSFF